MSSSTSPDPEKSAFYRLMPIKKEERVKVFVMCLLKWLFSLVFTMLKLQKSSNVVTEHGAEKIAYVKSFVFPITLLLIALYTACSHRLSQRQVLYGIIFFFLFLFSLYGGVLLPCKAFLTPDTTALQASWAHYPTVKAFLQIYTHWIQVFFYCAAELFGQFFIILFFWGIANELFTREAAKRLYHLFIAAGCLGSMVGTQTIQLITRSIQHPYGSKENIQLHKALILDQTSQVIAFCVLAVLCIVLLLYRWILQEPSMLSQPSVASPRQRGQKMSFLQGINYIFSNPYLIATTLLIVSCAVTTSLVDITYQKYIKKISDSLPAAYMSWSANQLFISDMCCIVSGFFLTHWVARRFSWQTNSYITPFVVMVMGGSFFLLSFLHHSYGLDGWSEALLGTKGFVIIAWFGFIQSISSVFTRYVFFDSTKEMIFISLAPDVRRKSKGAVDVVGSRLGKGLSSYLHVLILSLFQVGLETPPVERVSHVLLGVFLAFCLIWFGSIRYLAPTVDAT